MWILIFLIVAAIAFVAFIRWYDKQPLPPTPEEKTPSQRYQEKRVAQKSVYKEPTRGQYDRYTNSPIVKQHYKCVNREVELYKQVCQASDPFGWAAKELIRVCNDDIAISSEFRKLCVQCNQPIPLYPAFKYLAMLFEKRGEYQEAISTCEKAIAKGYDDDDTKSGMQGRIERLRKKV